ncbi:MAG TPA: alpha/beta fold hydrolase [Micromonosporaceae bacterium]|jgi:pimeloyl-ACP methyl ester carboxylesterase
MTAVAEVRQRKSTTVRLFAARPPVRAAFRVLEHVAPRLGARWAERIWFTLPRVGDPGRSRPAGPAAGVPFTVAVGGHTVVGQAWGEGPVVYLMHGWAGYGGQLSAFVPPLVASGHRVVAFDAPSHGRSDPGAYGPRSSSIPEFAEALTAVVAVHGPAHAIIAHSMGCMAAAVALCDGLRAGRLALIAPMASPVSYARQLAAALGFGDRTYRRLIARVERRVGAPMHHFDVPELGRAVVMPPTLIVHDRDDASTSVADAAAIAAAWIGSRLSVTSGLGHRRVLRDPDVVADVVEFVSG